MPVSSVRSASQASAGKTLIVGPNKNAYDTGVSAIEASTPMALMLKQMSAESKDWVERAEIACMLLEMASYEKHVCQYCRAPGHRRRVCPVFQRLRDRFRGDRDLNKLRGRKSMDLRI